MQTFPLPLRGGSIEALALFLRVAVKTFRAGPQPVESAFQTPGTLETAYSSNRRDAIESIFDAGPVAALM